VNVRLPDMSGPPVWWDAAVLLTVAVGLIGAVSHHYHHRLGG
jgi:hypothetical protein